MAYLYHRFSFNVPFFFSVKKAAMALDCSQSPIFSRDRLDIPRLPRLPRHGYLDFQMYRGGRRRGL